MLKTLQERSSGVLCHLSSLPGPWANGDLGPKAHAFAAWLADAGQSWWQFLPCHPTGAGDSPYQALSAFAGNPLFISLELLEKRGWLKALDLAPPRPLPEDRVVYGASFEFRFERLQAATKGFDKSASAAEKKDYADYCERESSWLDDWALFAALKREQGGRHWVEWPAPLRDAQAPELAEARLRLASELHFEKFAQFVFDMQWAELREKAGSLGVGLIGDMPIFVSHDSADVWAHRELFDLDAQGQPLKVAGVPPDYFSEDGQRWGNPLYRWDLHAASGFRWWVSRFTRCLRLFDAVRVDHFIGFHRYWEIPADSMTAKEGVFKPGPGAPFFEALKRELHGLPIIAEDLGLVTPEVTALRRQFSLPGMRVLQFSFGGEASQLPDQYEELCVAYTGTHDNDTCRGWLEELPSADFEPGARAAFKAERERALQWGKGKDERPVWSLIASVWETKCHLAIAPLQDILELGAEARMNIPGTAHGNWHWRCRAGLLKPEQSSHLRKLTETHKRL